MWSFFEPSNDSSETHHIEDTPVEKAGITTPNPWLLLNAPRNLNFIVYRSYMISITWLIPCRTCFFRTIVDMLSTEIHLHLPTWDCSVLFCIPTVIPPICSDTTAIGHMELSWNRGTPKSSIFQRIFHTKPSIWGYPSHLWKPSICSLWKLRSKFTPARCSNRCHPSRPGSSSRWQSLRPADPQSLWCVVLNHVGHQYSQPCLYMEVS